MSGDPSSDSLLGNKGEYRAYAYRWVNLFLFCLMSIMQNFLAFSFAPISETVVRYYAPTGKVNLAYVNLLNAITLLTAIPLFIWGPRLIRKYTLRDAIIYIAICDVIGGVLRYIFHEPTMVNYWFVFLGQGIISLGQVVTWAGPTKLSTVWFPDHQRPLATSMGSMSNLLGIASAFFFAPIIVPSSKPQQVETLLLIHMEVSLVLGAITLLLFRSAPPTPPSRSSTLNLLEPDKSEEAWTGEAIPETYCGQLKFMTRNYSFDLIAICFGLGFGFFNGLFTVMNQMMTNEGYTNGDVGMFGVLIVLGGVAGAAISGIVVGRTHRYKETFIVCLICATASMLWFTLAVKPDNRAQICLSITALGFFALAITPVALEVAVEYTHPIPESTSSGALCAWGSFLALIFIGVMSSLEDENGSLERANWMGFGGFCCATVSSFLLGTDYKRAKYDA